MHIASSLLVNWDYIAYIYKLYLCESFLNPAPLECTRYYVRWLCVFWMTVRPRSDLLMFTCYSWSHVTHINMTLMFTPLLSCCRNVTTWRGDETLAWRNVPSLIHGTQILTQWTYICRCVAQILRTNNTCIARTSEHSRNFSTKGERKTRAIELWMSILYLLVKQAQCPPKNMQSMKDVTDNKRWWKCFRWSGGGGACSTA